MQPEGPGAKRIRSGSETWWRHCFRLKCQKRSLLLVDFKQSADRSEKVNLERERRAFQPEWITRSCYRIKASHRGKDMPESAKVLWHTEDVSGTWVPRKVGIWSRKRAKQEFISHVFPSSLFPLSFLLPVYFEIGFHLSKAGLKFSMYLKITSSSWSSCFCPLSVGLQVCTTLTGSCSAGELNPEPCKW